MNTREKLGATATAVSASGAALNVAGIYSVTNAATGATMLASSAAGSSAAGTVGFLAGTHGVIGAIGATLIAPQVIVGAGCVAAVLLLPKIIRRAKER